MSPEAENIFEMPPHLFFFLGGGGRAAAHFGPNSEWQAGRQAGFFLPPATGTSHPGSHWG